MPQREAARSVLPAHAAEWSIRDVDGFVEDVRQALFASKVVAYSQGFDQIAAASEEYRWDIDRGAMARIWRGGCIIRARFLNRITEAYERTPNLALLIADEYFTHAISTALPAWRLVVAGAVQNGIPTPAFSSSPGLLRRHSGRTAPSGADPGQRTSSGRTLTSGSTSRAPSTPSGAATGPSPPSRRTGRGLPPEPAEKADRTPA